MAIDSENNEPARFRDARNIAGERIVAEGLRKAAMDGDRRAVEARKAARKAPKTGSTIGRAFEIFLRITWFVLWTLGWRLSFVHNTTPAKRFARLLEDLGTTFIKLGQALSMRTDLFPPDYLVELQKLQDDVRPFPVEESIAAIEEAFGKPPSLLFVRFDAAPLAAASVAQVHAARTFSGKEVVVKVLRPGVAIQVERDMRILTAVVRFFSHFSTLLTRYKAEEVVREIWMSLKRELDLREEARNAHRFAESFRGSQTILIPDVIMELCTMNVMVQERTFGKRIDELATAGKRADLAQILIDAYVQQFFMLGFFHGDPHPGNIFVTEDARVALHDFGIVGSLDRGTRHALAAFMLAFTEQDTEWVLDSWLELGMLTKTEDRDKLRPTVSALMSDYSRRPINEWSVGEAFGRLVTATRGYNFEVPLHLLVLARAIMLLEAVIRRLDPGFSLLDSLSSRSREVMEKALSSDQHDTRRLQFETAIAAHEWQRLLASMLRRAREEGIRVSIDHEGLPELSEHITQGSSRVSLALVTLGLYLAASLVMQFQSGPHILEFPALAAIFYIIAIWFTVRLVRAIGKRL
jgi:ubiquinone biosynthesis protein